MTPLTSVDSDAPIERHVKKQRPRIQIHHNGARASSCHSDSSSETDMDSVFSNTSDFRDGKSHRSASTDHSIHSRHTTVDSDDRSRHIMERDDKVVSRRRDDTLLLREQRRQSYERIGPYFDHNEDTVVIPIRSTRRRDSRERTISYEPDPSLDTHRRSSVGESRSARRRREAANNSTKVAIVSDRESRETRSQAIEGENREGAIVRFEIDRRERARAQEDRERELPRIRDREEHKRRLEHERREAALRIELGKNDWKERKERYDKLQDSIHRQERARALEDGGREHQYRRDQGEHILLLERERQILREQEAQIRRLEAERDAAALRAERWGSDREAREARYDKHYDSEARSTITRPNGRRTVVVERHPRGDDERRRRRRDEDGTRRERVYYL